MPVIKLVKTEEKLEQRVKELEEENDLLKRQIKNLEKVNECLNREVQSYYDIIMSNLYKGGCIDEECID